MKFDAFSKHLSANFLWTLFLCALALPCLYFATHFLSEIERLGQLDEKIDMLQTKAIRVKKQQEKETTFLANLKEADRFFIDKHLESCVFLETELKNLKVLNLDASDPLKKRLQFLKGDSNRLSFAEEKTRRKEGIQEVEAKLKHSVEMNEDDLKKVLSLIEDHQIGAYDFKIARPQLLIKRFDLTKKALSPQEEVFEVNLELIKRETVSQ